MTTIKSSYIKSSTIESSNSLRYYKICIVMIWAMFIYSMIIQNILFQIPYGMLILGGAILVSFIMANSDKPFVFREAMTEEDIRMLFFLAYILVVGLAFSPKRNDHISLWMTCLEYLFIQIAISTIIKSSGTDSFHNLLLAVSVMLALVFIRNPVNFHASGRYSISNEVNPNGLGMVFVAGIWAALYRQNKNGQPLILTGVIVGILGYCILLTGSRKSLIGASLTIIFWLLFCFFPSLKGKESWKGIVSFLAMIILAIVIGRFFLSTFATSAASSRMDKLFYEVSEGNRSDLYRDGLTLIKRNPIFGIGFNGFQYYFGSYSHATLVEVPVSGGIIGTFIYLSIHLITLKKLIITYRKTKKEQGLCTEHMSIKMLLILWVVLMLYTTCVIHPYQLESYIYFGIIFGEIAFIENKLNPQQDMMITKTIRSKYIKI